MKARPPLYFFNWPSNVGGADTKVTHLLLLLHEHYDITMVPNTREQLLQLGWRKFLKRLGVKAALWGDLPKKLNGVALSLCNGRFLGEGIVLQAKQRGLRVIWSSEMMWHHGPEIAAVMFGVIDKVLYVSEVQRAVLEAGYGMGTVSGKVGEWVSEKGDVPLTHSPTHHPLRHHWQLHRSEFLSLLRTGARGGRAAGHRPVVAAGPGEVPGGLPGILRIAGRDTNFTNSHE